MSLRGLPSQTDGFMNDVEWSMHVVLYWIPPKLTFCRYTTIRIFRWQNDNLMLSRSSTLTGSGPPFLVGCSTSILQQQQWWEHETAKGNYHSAIMFWGKLYYSIDNEELIRGFPIKRQTETAPSFFLIFFSVFCLLLYDDWQRRGEKEGGERQPTRWSSIVVLYI